MNRTRLKADLTLFLVAIIWGSAFAAQRVAAEHIGPFLFNGSRFLLGGLVLLPLVRFRLSISAKNWLWIGAAGVLLCGGSVLQQAGLRWTTAGNAGFITGLYVVLVPLLMLVIWRHRMGWTVWLAAGVAGVGIFLLSAGGRFELAPGDGFELAGAFLWAGHVIIVGKAVQRINTLPFAIGQCLVAGFLNLILGLVFESNTLPGLLPAWWTVAYVGIFSVAIAYTLQAKGQKHAPPTDASLILSLESVFAALFGYLLLGETLQPIQWLGAGLILAAILMSQFAPSSEKPSESPQNSNADIEKSST
jgi:drug/metabolite transporter (DMT)-like permease